MVSDSFATPRTVASQAPLSMGFSRQEYWSELTFPSSGDLPDPGIEPRSLALAGGFFTTEPPGKPSLLIDLLRKGWCGGRRQDKENTIAVISTQNTKLP